MDYGEFIAQVRERGKLQTEEEAKQVIQATLRTLGERIGGEARRHLATQLAKELAAYVESTEDRNPEVFPLEEFYNRVSARSEMGFPQAVPLSQVVMSVLQDAIASGEQRQVLFELPEEYKQLFGLKPESPGFVRYTRE